LTNAFNRELQLDFFSCRTKVVVDIVVSQG
jgi:hypothetical protein